MEQRFEAEELDGTSLEYLRTVRERQGDGMPGIYLDASAAGLVRGSLPAWGAFAGLVLIPFTLWMTLWSLHDPINVAMLQTAGVFLGGWLIVAWIRTEIEQSRPDYIGHFKYFDTLYLWHGGGRGVWVTSLSGMTGATVHHNYNDEGGYTQSTVSLHLDGGRKVDVPVKLMDQAYRLEAFLEALLVSSGSPVERGYQTVEEIDGLMQRDDEGRPIPQRPRVVDHIPEPHRERRVSGWWRYPVVIVLFGLFFLGSWMLSTILRDDAIFDLVKLRRPPELRAYLIDRRNTRHRDEVGQRLAQFHEDSARRVEALKGEDRQLRLALAGIVRHLKTETRPIVTIHVKQTYKREAGAPGLQPALNQTLRTGLVRELSEYLAQNVGEEIAAYAEVTERPAMIEIDANAVPEVKNGRTVYRVEWKVTVQAAPEATKATLDMKTEPPPFGENDFQLLQHQYKAFVAQFRKALSGV